MNIEEAINQVALDLGRDPRSIRKVAAGGRIRGFVATHQIRAALRRLGWRDLRDGSLEESNANT